MPPGDSAAMAYRFTLAPGVGCRPAETIQIPCCSMDGSGQAGEPTGLQLFFKFKHMSEELTLRDLEPGDIFVHKNSRAKNPTKYLVYGNPEFSQGHGSAIKRCRTLAGEPVNKSCKLEVIKISESIHKKAILEKFKAK
jgi:hypothetical protein